MVVVRPKPGKPTLNLESILFIERGRRVLGRVFDVFGQVSDPHYCVRFNNSKHIQENNIKVGMNVYFCPNTEYTSVVFLHELTKYVNLNYLHNYLLFFCTIFFCIIFVNLTFKFCD